MTGFRPEIYSNSTIKYGNDYYMLIVDINAEEVKTNGEQKYPGYLQIRITRFKASEEKFIQQNKAFKYGSDEEIVYKVTFLTTDNHNFTISQGCDIENFNKFSPHMRNVIRKAANSMRYHVFKYSNLPDKLKECGLGNLRDG
jgi:hypothetical protein